MSNLFSKAHVSFFKTLSDTSGSKKSYFQLNYRYNQKQTLKKNYDMIEPVTRIKKAKNW
jgi:hypothetical protein